MSGPLRDEATTLEVVLFSGDRVQFRRFEFGKALLHRYMLLHYLLHIAFLSQLELFTVLAEKTAPERLFLVSLSVVAAVGPLILYALVRELLQKPGTVLVIKASRHIAVAAALSTMACEVALNLMDGRPIPGLLHLLVIWASFYVITEIIAHYVLLIVMRRVLADRRGPEAEVRLDPVEAAQLEIKGQRVKVADLYRVSAEGNYIRVITAEGQHFLPGPFGPVADALPVGLGMRVSRSDWVARGAVTGARRSGRDLWLDLADGSSLRVAQAKRMAVQDWIGGPDQGDGSAMSIQTG